MSHNFISLFLACAAIFVLAAIGFLPLLFVSQTVRGEARTPRFWLTVAAVVLGAALVATFLLETNSYPDYLSNWGRISFAVAHLLLGLALLIGILWLLLKIWPKGGA